jgi:hypothetical protein
VLRESAKPGIPAPSSTEPSRPIPSISPRPACKRQKPRCLRCSPSRLIEPFFSKFLAAPATAFGIRTGLEFARTTDFESEHVADEHSPGKRTDDRSASKNRVQRKLGRSDAGDVESRSIFARGMVVRAEARRCSLPGFAFRQRCRSFVAESETAQREISRTGGGVS